MDFSLQKTKSVRSYSNPCAILIYKNLSTTSGVIDEAVSLAGKVTIFVNGVGRRDLKNIDE